jgi:hypothetical protein
MASFAWLKYGEVRKPASDFVCVMFCEYYFKSNCYCQHEACGSQILGSCYVFLTFVYFEYM